MVITISNRYGCGAIAIAHALAERLGYEYVDQQLPVVVAKRLNTSAQAVESAESAAVRSVSERMLRALQVATPELRTEPTRSFERECLREVQEAVREYAAHGNAVIVGRAAGSILGRRPGVLRVFLYAPRDWRVHRIMEGHGVDERTASSEIDRIDGAREAYTRSFYGMKWGEPESYDLCIDTASFGIDGAAALIAQAVGGR